MDMELPDSALPIIGAVPPPSKSHWHNWLPLGFLLLLTVWLVAMLVFKGPHPPVGFYIGVLAFVAGIVTIWPPENAWSRACWLIVLGGFLVLEITTLYEQRSEDAAATNKARKDEDDRFAQVLSKQDQTFAETLQGFTTQAHSAQTILDRATDIFKLTQENLEAIMGVGSVPCILPQSHAATADGTIPLVVWNRGKNDLTGVEVRLLSENQFLDQRSIFYKAPAELGTLYPTWPKPLPEGVRPEPASNGIANYLAEIWTQNGYYNETLNFRRNKYGTLPWAYQYWAVRQVMTTRQTGKIPAHTMMAQPLSECMASQWSDDLGDGKPPTPKPR